MGSQTSDPSEYGSHVADGYDEIYDGVYDTDGAVARLAELAGPGPVLELGIGTGRVALPLAARGLKVHGVDGSAEMLGQLASKPGGKLIATTCGDFSETTVPGLFSLVFLLVNTIYALPSQEAQIRCFALAARHLAVGGRFVVEAWVPDPPRERSRVRPRRLAEGLTGLVVETHDPVMQILSTTQVILPTAGYVRTFPVVHRYAWPAELDLMARLAGMSLENRWSDWNSTPFDHRSSDHISVWHRTAAGDGP